MLERVVQLQSTAHIFVTVSYKNPSKCMVLTHKKYGTKIKKKNQVLWILYENSSNFYIKKSLVFGFYSVHQDASFELSNVT